MKHEPRLPDEQVNYDRENPVRDVPLLLGGIAAVAAALIFTGAFLVDILVPRIPTHWEVSLFAHLPIPTLGTEAGSKQQLDTAAVLLQRLAAHRPDDPYPHRLGIIEDDAPNALALPGGTILVTTGLLKQAESENELAFVLGHELGHFRSRDHLRGLGRGVLTMMVVGTLSEGLLADAGAFLGEVAMRSYGRDQERAADAFGLGLVFAEYGHVAGADDFFTRRLDQDAAIPAPYFSTHPLEAERIATLARLADEREWPQTGRLTTLDWATSP